MISFKADIQRLWL